MSVVEHSVKLPVENRDRPSAHGAVLGEAHSDIAKAGGAGTDLLDAMCATCAFREGCMTNQMAGTGKVALDCLLTGEDFACHHGMKDGEPTKLCAGYFAAKRAPWPVVMAAVSTVAARLETLPPIDEIRARFDVWRKGVDPDGKMDNYQLSRAYAAKDRRA